LQVKTHQEGSSIIYDNLDRDVGSIWSENGSKMLTILQSECFRAKMNPIFTLFSTGSNFVPKQNSASAVQDFLMEFVIAHILHCPDLSFGS